MERLDELLESRSRVPPWYRGGSLWGAIALHLLLVTAAIFAPRLFAERPRSEEYVSVTIVPAAALGQVVPPPPAPPSTPDVVPAPPEERRAPAPEKRPEKPVQAEAEKPAPSPERRSAEAMRSRPAAHQAESLDLTQPESTAPPGRLGSPQGSPLATGGPTEISGFDDPDFSYSYYADLMLARIRAKWQRPPLGGDVEMVLHFRIHEDGHISDVEILRSSGYNSFDRAGLRAVQSATLPPLPTSYGRSSLGVRLIIR